MICKNCGSQLEEGSKFCGICGTKVEDNEQIQPLNEVPTTESVENVDLGIGANNSDVNTVENVEPTINSVVDNAQSSSVEPAQNLNVEPVQDSSLGVSNTEVDNSFSEKPKKNFVGPIIGIIALLFIVGGIYCYFNNKSRTVKSLINNAYEKFDKLTLKDEFNIEEKSILLTGDLSITTNIPELSDLSGEKFNYTIGLDYPNKKMEMGASLEENGLKIIDAAMYFMDNSAYVSLKDDFDKLIKIDGVDLGEIFSATTSSNLTEADIKYLVKAYKDILIDSLDIDDFVKSSATITLNGKDTKVSKLTYDMTSERAIKLVNNIIDGTLKDSKLLDILSKATGSSVDELKDELSSSKISNTSSSNSTITFDIYTKGFNNEFVGMDIQGIIQIRKNDDGVTIEAGMGSEKISLVIKSLSDDSCIIELNSNITGAEFSGSLSITGKEVSKDLYEGSIILSVNYQGNSLGITSNYKEQLGAEIANIDVSNAVSYENLTEADMNKLSENILTKIEGSNLYKIIENFSFDSSYDYNYDYDLDDYDLDF